MANESIYGSYEVTLKQINVADKRNLLQVFITPQRTARYVLQLLLIDTGY